jgi:hypothetical protein
MSKISADSISSRSGGNIEVGNDINVVGIITATSFSGDGTDLDLSNNPTAGGSFSPVNYIIN